MRLAPAHSDAASRAAPWPHIAASISAGISVAVYLTHASLIVRLPLEPLLSLVPDDAFYYVGIARHLAASGRPTFDGMNPTNGFHPGWMVLLTLVSSMTPTALDAVRGALVLGYVLHFATAVALFLLFRRGSGTLVAPMLGSLLWLLNPFPLLLVAQGVESALLLFAVVVFFHVHLRALDGLERGMHPGLEYACAAAFVAWARTDAALLPALGFLQLLARGTRGTHVSWTLARHAGVVALLVLPWVAFSWMTTGSVIQDSAAMKATWRSLDARIGNDPVGWQVLGAAWFGIPASWLFGAVRVPVMLGVARVLLIVGAAGAVLRLPQRSPWRDLIVLGIAWLLLAGTAYAWTITDLQVWHFAPCGIVLFLVTWVGWSRLAAVTGRRWRPLFTTFGGLALAGCAWLAVASGHAPPALYPWQPDIYWSVNEFDRLLPADAVVGSFGAGIPGTLGKRPVVNLDGLVNHSVVRYWRQHRWDEYLRAAGITHIADDHLNLDRARRFSRGAVAVIPLASVPLTAWHSNPRVLWKLEPARVPAADAEAVR